MYKFMLHGIWHKLVYSIFISIVALSANHVLLLLFIMLIKHKHYDYVLNTLWLQVLLLSNCVHTYMVTCTIV